MTWRELWLAISGGCLGMALGYTLMTAYVFPWRWRRQISRWGAKQGRTPSVPLKDRLAAVAAQETEKTA